MMSFTTYCDGLPYDLLLHDCVVLCSFAQSKVGSLEMAELSHAGLYQIKISKRFHQLCDVLSLKVSEFGSQKQRGTMREILFPC